MNDQKKVIKGLELLHDRLLDAAKLDAIAMLDASMVADAITMLKEQEAVEPIKMQRMDSNFSFFVPYFLCGNCRYELVGKDVMFCSHCGQAVKWNEI